MQPSCGGPRRPGCGGRRPRRCSKEGDAQDQAESGPDCFKTVDTAGSKDWAAPAFAARGRGGRGAGGSRVSLAALSASTEAFVHRIDEFASALSAPLAILQLKTDELAQAQLQGDHGSNAPIKALRSKTGLLHKQPIADVVPIHLKFNALARRFGGLHFLGAADGFFCAAHGGKRTHSCHSC